MISFRKLAVTAFSAATLLGGLQGAAHADSFTFATQGTDEIISVSHYSGVYVGRYTATINGGPGINIFCVDFNQEISNPDSYTANLSQGLTASADPHSATSLNTTGYYNGGLVSALTSSDYAPNAGGPISSYQQRANAVAYLADTYLDAVLTNDQAAAIQLSIWDIIQDGADGLGAGQGQVYLNSSSPLSSLVSTYEAQAIAHDTAGSGTALWLQAPRTSGSTNPAAHKQEFVIEDGNVHPQGSPVPEPGPLAMFASLATAVGGMLLKRLRNRSTM